MDKFDFLDKKLSDLREKHLFRSLNCIESAGDGLVRFKGCDSDKVLLCSNDYLNIAGDKRVKEAVCHAVDKYGYGAGSSRLICGTQQAHTINVAHRNHVGKLRLSQIHIYLSPGLKRFAPY